MSARTLLPASAAVLAALVFGAGCLPAAAPLPEGAGAPAFRPEVFFAGRSHGDPVVAIRTRGSQQLRVESVGAAGADGAFHLDQTIAYPGGRTETRRWTMRPLPGGRYATTLTPDARGPVEVWTEGPRLRIRYRMGRTTTMDQTLALRAGGQVADNVATVRMMGMPIARITETITRDVE